MSIRNGAVLDSFVRAIGTDFKLVQGVISTAATPAVPPDFPFPYCGVKMMGSTVEILGLRFSRNYIPIVGDVVMIVWTGTDGFVLCKLEDAKSSMEKMACSVYLSLNQALANGVFQNIIYDTVQEDPLGMYNTGTGFFTVPPGGGGKWLLIGQTLVNCAPGQAGSSTCYIGQPAGTEKLRGTSTANVGGNPGNHVSGTLRLAAGVTFNMVGFQNGGALPLLGGRPYNYFMAQWIGP